MAKFRVVRGGIDNGRKWGIGSTYEADNAKAAVAKDEEETRKAFGCPGPLGVFAGTKPAPIVAVFELVPVPESDWR